MSVNQPLKTFAFRCLKTGSFKGLLRGVYTIQIWGYILKIGFSRFCLNRMVMRFSLLNTVFNQESEKWRFAGVLCSREVKTRD